MTVRNLVLRSLVAFKWCFRSVWLWALLYLLAIPLFGFYFTLHGEEFRTAGPDARASTNLNRLMRELSVAAEHTLDNYSAGVPPTLKSISGGQVADSQVNFKLTVAMTDSNELAVEIQFGCSVNGSGSDYGLDGKLDTLFIICPATERPVASLPIPINRLFPAQDGSLNLSPDAGEIPVGPGTVDLERIVEAEFAGGTGVGSDRLVRMTYFSAVTITTIGYGDIVPVTDSMRAAILLEAVWGLLCVGLFLNAMAQRLVRGQTQ